MTHHPLLISYVNVQAQAIINTLHCLECGNPRPGLPNLIIVFCLDLLEALDARRDADMPSSFQLDRELCFGVTSIVLRGLGLPRSSEVDQSRICILMEERESERHAFSLL